MLETIWLKLEMENKYIQMLFFSLIFSLVVIGFTRMFIPLPTGIAAVFLVALTAAYPFVRHLKHEEETESNAVKKLSESSLLKRHSREIIIYGVFFIGVTLAFMTSYYIFGPEAFAAQLEGADQTLTGKVTGADLGFVEIMSNNLMVFGITFLLSLLVSAGIVFILVWNASVLGIFVANSSGNAMSASVNILSYLPHGLIEISGYALAGLSASLLAYQLERKIRNKSYATGMLSVVIIDVVVLAVISVGLLTLGAFVEVI